MDRDILIGVGAGVALFVLLFVAVGLWIRSDLKKLFRHTKPKPRRESPAPSERPRPPRTESPRWVISRTVGRRPGLSALPPLPPLPALPPPPAIDFSRMDQALMQIQEHIDGLGRNFPEAGFFPGVPAPVSFETDGQNAFAVVGGERYELQTDRDNIIPMPDGSLLTITLSPTEIRTARTQPRTPAASNAPLPVRQTKAKTACSCPADWFPPNDTELRAAASSHNPRCALFKSDTPKPAPTAWERLMNDDEAPCPTTTTSAPKTKG